MTPRSLTRCIRRASPLLMCLPPLVAAAQGISIQTPQLPPRGQPGATPPAQGAPAQQPPVYGQQPAAGTQPGYGTAATPQADPAQQPAFGQPQGSAAGAYGTQPGYGSSATGQAAQSPGSPLQQRAAGGSAYGSAYGQAYQPQSSGSGATPQVAMVAPVPSAPGGTCRVKPSPDRQTMSLLGPDGQPRRHVPLGDFRVQRVVHSPDGLWAVALTKLRGEPQFAALTLDLTRCETAHTVELPAAGEDVRFEADAAVVQMAGGERRVRLADPRDR